MAVHKRKGFTLLEMLIVVGVILLLVGLLLVGLGVLAASSKARATRQTLENLSAMLTEYGTARTLKEFEGGPVAAPGSVQEGAPGRYGPAVRDTVEAYARMVQIPPVRQAMERLPTDQLMSVQEAEKSGLRTDVRAVLDAWSNPIICVPTGGLSGVNVAGTPRLITSSGEATSRMNRPFFASAGPDGDFAKGDDNLYSFEN